MAQQTQRFSEFSLDELAALERPVLGEEEDEDMEEDCPHTPMPVFGVQLPANPRLPDILVDGDNTYQPFGSRIVLANQVAVAAQDVYAVQDLFQVSFANDDVREQLYNYVNAKQPMAEGEIDLKAAMAVELALDVILRARNQNVMPFLSIVLGVMFLSGGATQRVRGRLTFGYVIHTHSWIRRFCRLLDAELRRRMRGEEYETNFIIAVADNKGYMLRTKYQHQDRAGEFLETVNWFQVPIPRSLPTSSVRRGDWRVHGQNHYHVRNYFDPNSQRVEDWLTNTWLFTMQWITEGRDILAHPRGSKGPRTFWLAEEPIVDCGTTSNAHVRRIMARIKHTALPGREMVGVIGDGQTYCRTIQDMCDRPHEYAWLIPLLGEWHFGGPHVLMAIHLLWFLAFICHIVAGMGYEKSIKRNWTVEQYSHYDNFYQLLIWRLSVRVQHVVPRHLLSNPHRLFVLTRRNLTATLALTFLFRFALPWLRLRQAVRANKRADIDIMHVITYHWFRATPNAKIWYSIITVVAMAIRHAMNPEVARVWESMGCMSLTGKVHVAYDFGNEKLNRMFSQLVGSNPTREKLINAASLINAYVWIMPRFDRAMGLGAQDEGDDDDDSAAYMHVTAAANAPDVAKMDALLEAALPNDFEWWCGRSYVNRFDPNRSRRTPNPADRVRRTAMGNEDNDAADDDDGDDGDGGDDGGGGDGGGGRGPGGDGDGGDDGEDDPSDARLNSMFGLGGGDTDDDDDDDDVGGPGQDDEDDPAPNDPRRVRPWWKHVTKVLRENVPWKAWSTAAGFRA